MKKGIFSASMAAMVTLLPECSKRCGGKMVMVAWQPLPGCLKATFSLSEFIFSASNMTMWLFSLVCAIICKYLC